ncbi:helix-hairpin-helix domain-containing protein [Halospeciosus flavus]|uniref:DNA polymerase beta n=1 Tax=Halospeciosus flavus TaxID=3032283 RepID=A0ABD5Z0G5_9EURY|nr:helix-hairpin-helix domain-containing protein [Halospeciosus flavus]
MPASNREVAARLHEIADLLELQDVDYKPRAYRRAARNVAAHDEDVETLAERGALQDVEGVGDSIEATIREYLETGSIDEIEELRTEAPLDWEGLTSVEGVGPERAKQLYRELGVETVEDLERAAERGEIRDLDGFGERAEANLREHARRARRDVGGRVPLGVARPLATSVREHLAGVEPVDSVTVVGSFRRRRPTVGDLDVLATADADDAPTVMDALCGRSDVTEVVARGETKTTVRVDPPESPAMQVDLRVVAPNQAGAARVYFTGSTDHNIGLRSRADDRGWTLNEYGLFRDDERLAGETEAGIYDALDLDWVPPELREATGELDAAAAGDLPDLVTVDAVDHDPRVHVDADDAEALHTAADRASARDLDRLTVVDERADLVVDGTLDRDRFEARREAVARVDGDESVPVDLRYSLLATVGRDGELDVPPAWADDCDALAVTLPDDPGTADLDADVDPTEWVVRAFESAPVDRWVRPTRRTLPDPDPLDVDLDRAVAAAAETDVAVEVSAHPRHLELDWEAVKAHRDAVDYVVASGARDPSDVGRLELGVAQARRGWCTVANVRNARVEDGAK